MAKFRHKPTVVYAEQYTGPASVSMNEPLPMYWAGIGWLAKDASGERFPYIVTPSGQTVQIDPKDWIVVPFYMEEKGYYRWRPEVFAAFFEPAE